MKKKQQQAVVQRIGKAVEAMPDEMRRYVLGYAEGWADSVDAQRKKKEGG